MTTVRRNPCRACRTLQASARYQHHGFAVVKFYCRFITAALLLTQGRKYDNSYLINIFLDNDFEIHEKIPSDVLMHSPHAMKASATHNPDTPCLHEVICGPDREVYLQTPSQDIYELETHDTWTIVH